MKRFYGKMAGYVLVAAVLVAFEAGIRAWGVDLPVSSYQGPVLMTGVMIGVKYSMMVFLASLVAGDFLKAWFRSSGKGEVIHE